MKIPCQQVFGSTAHGAGRMMSRSKARRDFTESEVKKSLNDKGIFIKSLTRDGVVEETPQAYKDVDAVVNVSHNLGIATKVAKLVSNWGDQGMSDEDKELEILKAKRLAEMQKNLSMQDQSDKSASEEIEKPKLSLRDYVVNSLGYRGMEVLQNSEYQFPNESKIIIEKLGELISSGDINETLDGGKLLVLFRSVGLSIRMENKINVEKDGKFISIADKFKKTNNDDKL